MGWHSANSAGGNITGTERSGNKFLLGAQPVGKRSSMKQVQGLSTSKYLCRARTAHIRQFRPDSGLGFQVKILDTPDSTHRERLRERGAQRERV